LKNITIIGNGNMAFAIAKGLSKDYKLKVVGRDISKLKKFRDDLDKDIEIVELKDGFSINNENIILAVKPYAVDEVSKLLTGKAEKLFSVLAGTTLSKLRDKFESKHYVRAMPNLSALFQKSMTSLAGDKSAKEDAIALFSSIGLTIWFESEDEIDVATAIAGSGPAYLSLVAEALADGGVKAGLKRADAQKLVAGLFRGFSPLLKHHKPAEIKDSVMSPKGTTAYGYASLEERGVRSAFIKAVESAHQRAVVLGITE
jgi:pyrroline-5-carboxylate reductase